jgi:hypothetical protein
MSCPLCGSDNQEDFPGELMLHFRGLQNVHKPGVMIFPTVLVCLECGLSQFSARPKDLTLLAQDNSMASRNGTDKKRNVCPEMTDRSGRLPE